jgi:hypothetical protein
MKDLSREQFAQMFGFCLIYPTKKVLRRAQTINQLFDALSHELGIESGEVFRSAGVSREEHLVFLRNVASCPPRIVRRVRRMLAPNSREQRRHIRKNAPR